MNIVAFFIGKKAARGWLFIKKIFICSNLYFAFCLGTFQINLNGV
jgi:hypothetical protein